MFFAPAHSFIQQARLAITLAWIAGYTNVISVLVCGTVVSHVSGTTSYLGEYIAEGTWLLAGYALFLLLTFFSGSVASAACTELGRRRGWDSIYVLPMAIEAALLAMFTVGLELTGRPGASMGAGVWLMTGLASMAMGVQNATITKISSGVVRTTHVTGVLTDLGLESVQFMLWAMDKRRDTPPGSTRALIHSVQVHPTARRLVLLLSILLSFALGACLGTLIHESALRVAMFPPVLLLVWIIFQDIRRPIAELEGADVRGHLLSMNLPGALAVYHIRRNAAGRTGMHRMPDLTAWSESLPGQIRVVVLDLTDVSEFDADAALELRAAISRLASQGRRMVVAGLTNKEYARLIRAGAGEGLRPENVCPDLDLAIARGLNLVEDAAISDQIARGR